MNESVPTDRFPVRTCLWFHDRGEEAANFYVSLVPHSHIDSVEHLPGDTVVVRFSLGGVPYMILQAGPHFTLSPAASIMVVTPNQKETDRLWDALTADGGEESRCGWLVDRFGMSWQIVPDALFRSLGAKDPAAATRAREAMFKMAKIDIAALEAAAAG
ncbi:MAG: VOC family protein [Sandaracinaceae bacterium]